MISNNIYNNLQTIQIFKLTTETPKQNRSNVRQTSLKVRNFISIETISLYTIRFPGTCVSRRFYNNFISKSKSNLKFIVKLKV